MSLRIFHIVFVVVCVLLCLFVGVWGIRLYVATKESLGLALGSIFLIAGIALTVYGQRVYGKLKGLA
jgi:DNA-binding transcriptional regulator of glucitol operon